MASVPFRNFPGRLLEGEIGEMRSRLEGVMEQGLPRLFLVEAEHELILREAELAWVRKLVREIQDGTLGGMGQWEAFHQGRDTVDAGRTDETVKEAEA